MMCGYHTVYQRESVIFLGASVIILAGKMLAYNQLVLLLLSQVVVSCLEGHMSNLLTVNNCENVWNR